MILKSFSALIIASTASAIFTMEAAANPRFSVQNNTNQRVSVDVYNGNDKTCTVPSKTKTVKAGKSKTIGCEGHGTGNCIVHVYKKKNGKKVCKNDFWTCGKEVSNGEWLMVDGSKDCDTYSNPPRPN